MNKNEKLLDVIGQIRDEYIEEANSPLPRRRKSPWIGIAAAAACLALAAAALFSGLFRGHTAHAEGYVDIYYIGENAEMTSEPVYTELTQDKVVTAWSEKNSVEDVTVTAVTDASESTGHDNRNSINACMVKLSGDVTPNKLKGLKESLITTLQSCEDIESVFAQYSDDTNQKWTIVSDHTIYIDYQWLFILPDGTVFDESGEEVFLNFTLVIKTTEPNEDQRP